MVDSTLYPGEKRRAYNVRYTVDNATQEFEEDEIRPLLSLPIAEQAEREKNVDQLIVAYDYLESRITGNCATSNYSCEHMYLVCKHARAFNPSYATQFLTPAHVDSLVATITPLQEHVDIHLLKQQLPSHLATAQNVDNTSCDDVAAFSQQVLHFWKNASKDDMSEWRLSARIVFGMSPNSVSCERVFSLLAAMYNNNRESVLADHVQSSLMMRYNKRSVDML